MISSCFRRFLALVLLTLLPLVSVRADDFFGPTYIDFGSRGYPAYDLWFSADLAFGGSAFATASSSFGGLWASSYSYVGKAGTGMYIKNIHKSGGQWIAESVMVHAFNNVTGQNENTYYYNYVLPSAATVYGSAECNGFTSNVRGAILGRSSP